MDSRLVVGTLVKCLNCGMVGELLVINLTRGNGIVREVGTSHLVNVTRCDLRLATMDEVKAAEAQPSNSIGCAKTTSTKHPSRLVGR